MPFGNPVVGGRELVRNAIQSPNFALSGANPAMGWQINRDGSSFFVSTNAGDASGDTASYNTISAIDSFLYQGQELSDYINSLNIPQGTVAQGSFAAPSPEAAMTTTEQRVIQINCDIDGTRSYTFHVSPFGLRTASGQRVIALIRYRLSSGGDATITDPNVQIWQSTPAGIVAVSGEVRIDGLATGNYNFSLTLRVVSPAASTANIAAGDLINLWVEDAGLTTTNTAKNMLTGAAPAATKKLQIASSGSRSYDVNGNIFAAANLNQYMYQGTYQGSPYGNQRSWMLFDPAAGGGGSGSLNDMVGVSLANIAYFDLFLYYPHWWYSSGGIALVGFHNVTSLGTTEPGGGTYQSVSYHWPGANVGQWIPLKGNAAIMAAVNAGTFKGCIISGQTTANPDYLSYYGFAYGSGGSRPPVLRAKYTK